MYIHVYGRRFLLFDFIYVIKKGIISTFMFPVTFVKKCPLGPFKKDTCSMWSKDHPLKKLLSSFV